MTATTDSPTDSPTVSITASITSDQIDHIASIVRAARSALEGHTVMSQRYCVDVLLDVFNATDSVDLRSAVARQLSGMRDVGSVLADEMQADLDTIVTLATTCGAIDLDWAEHLLAA